MDTWSYGKVENVPFILVGTKADLINQVRVTSEDARKFLKKHGGYEHVLCSARSYTTQNNHGVSLVFKTAINCHLNNIKNVHPKKLCNCVLL